MSIKHRLLQHSLGCWHSSSPDINVGVVISRGVRIGKILRTALGQTTLLERIVSCGAATMFVAKSAVMRKIAMFFIV